MTFRKRSIALLFFVILFAVQTILIRDNWSLAYFVQAFILDVAIILGIYAFRGFDNATIKSFNACIVSYIFGTAAALVLLLVVIAFIHPHLPGYELYITVAISVLGLSFLGFFSIRWMINRLPPRKYLIIGRENEVGHLMEEAIENSMGKIQIYRYINPSAAVLTQEVETRDITKAYDAILIGNVELAKTVSDILEDAHRRNIKIDYLPNIIENNIKRIPMELMDQFKDYYDVAFSDVEESPGKRVLDIFISLVGIVLSSPIFLILYMIIVLTDGRPAIFTQERVGPDGTTFTLHKFRSMKKHSEKNGAKYVTDQKDMITGIGKFMRPIRFDEIPQFYDIFMGRMSFTGPRPEQPKFAKELEKDLPYYNFRHRLKPGLSGWAQINYKYAATLEEQEKKLSYDLYYIKHSSVLFDLQIILRTIETIVFRRGAK